MYFNLKKKIYLLSKARMARVNLRRKAKAVRVMNLRRKCLLALVMTVMAVINVSFFLLREKEDQQIMTTPVVLQFGALESIQNYKNQDTTLAGTKKCKGLLLTLSSKSQGTFQNITNQNGFVFSAYADGERGVVTAILLRQGNASRDKLYCQGWYSGRSELGGVNDEGGVMVEPAMVKILKGGHGLKYNSYILTCPLPASANGIRLAAVAVVTNRTLCEAAPNILIIPEAPEVPAVSLDFTVCVAPLSLNYSKADELVEMLEMNKLLGAQRFVFYNFSMAPNVNQVLHHYSQQGEVEMVPWHLPMRTAKCSSNCSERIPEIHYFGQVAALNDCLYRYRHSSRYIVFQDIDEFIVPKHYATWGELITHRTESFRSVFGSGPPSVFLFRCVFFRKEWAKLDPDFSGNTVALKYNSNVLRHTIRGEWVFPFNKRSKYIVVPRLVTSVMIHEVDDHTGTIQNIPEEEALLQHYRSLDFPGDKQAMLEDTSTIRRFGHKLADKLVERWKLLPGVPLNYVA